MQFLHLTYIIQVYFYHVYVLALAFYCHGSPFPCFYQVNTEKHGRSFRGENGQAARTTGGRNEDSEDASDRCLWPERAGAWPSCRSGLGPGGDASPQDSSGAVAAAGAAAFAALPSPLPDRLLWLLSLTGEARTRLTAAFAFDWLEDALRREQAGTFSRP